MKSLKSLLSISVLFAFGLISCGAINTPDENSGQIETIVAETLQAYTAAAPVGITVSFKNVSFIIPNGLASGAVSEVVPAAKEDEAAPWDVAPEHLVFTLQDYAVIGANQAIQPKIYVYPAQAFEESNPGAGKSIPELKNLLQNPTAPIDLNSAPGVPFYNAQQNLIAKGGALNFQNGGGIRIIAHYAQYPSPILQNDQIYQYQGLADMGEYYVIAIFPILSPLQSTADNPSADGSQYPDPYSATPGEMDAYYQAIADKLNAADSSAFSPSLNILDALVKSIQISP